MSQVPQSMIEIRDAVLARRVSAAEITKAALGAIERENGRINAFTQVFAKAAMENAARVDARLASGETPALAGVPIAVKDNMCTGPDLAKPGDGAGYAGFTTCASRILEQYASPFTSTAVQRLIDAGAIIVGKTNLDEFAMGSSTEHSIFGATRNPWDVARVPGGSSGGSAAAVAAGLVPLALGSDTGGSIRQPAAFCGVFGLKPTYGRVSRYGLVAFASSLDQIGPITRNATDAALALEIMGGKDPLDGTSSLHASPRLAQMDPHDTEPLRIGVVKQARSGANHPAVAAALESTIAQYVKLGARIVEVDLPLIDHGIAAYYIVAPAEASSNLARLDGVRFGRRAKLGPGEGLEELYARSRGEGFGAEVKRRIMLGTHVLSSGYYDAYYHTALKVRRRLLGDFERAFETCDAILMPATPGPAFRLGEKTGDPIAMYLEDVYTVTVNLAGLPGLSMPAGLAEVDGRALPVGVQLVGRAFDEARLLSIARRFERATDWHARQPPR